MAEPKRRSASEILGRIGAMEKQIADKDLISCIYGLSGVGKTILNMAVAQAIRGDEDWPILFLDSSDGFVSLEDFPSLMEGVDRYRVDDYRDLSVIGDSLQHRRKGFETYGLTVMDEVSSWYLDMLHAWVREDEGLPADAPLPDIQGKQYGPPTHALLDIVGKFHKTPDMHLLLVSHEQERGGEAQKRAEPSLPPAFLRGLNQKMHLVARVEGVIRTDGYKRSVQTQPSRRVVAKSRISTLAVVEEYENVPDRIAEWLGSATQVNDLSKPVGKTPIYEDEEIQMEEAVADDDVVEVA
jgi:hypothetical protein